MGVIDYEKYYLKKEEMLKFIYSNQDKYDDRGIDKFRDIISDYYIDKKFWNIPVSYNLGIVNRKLAARRFSEGRSVYFILGEAGYGWSRVLSYIEAIRRSESSKIERRMGLW